MSIFLMGGTYAYVAMIPNRPELVVFLSNVNVSLYIHSALVAFKRNINPFRFPSTSLFATVSVLVSFCFNYSIWISFHSL